jgi:hypothetical protein
MRRKKLGRPKGSKNKKITISEPIDFIEDLDKEVRAKVATQSIMFLNTLVLTPEGIDLNAKQVAAVAAATHSVQKLIAALVG